MKFALNIQKNKQGSVKNLEREQNRDNRNNRNKQIDPSRSHLNYELVSDSRNLYQKTSQLVEASKNRGSRIRTDSVVDVSSIITVSLENYEKMGDEWTKSYFSAVVDWYKEEFGEENITSAIVHMDESAPHIHIHQTPINLENGRLQAHKVMTRGQIIRMQNEIPKYLKSKGFEVERGSDGSAKNYVKSIPELKRKTMEEVENIERYRELLEPIVEKMDRKYQEDSAKAEKLSKELKTMNKELEKIPQRKHELEEEMEMLKQEKINLENTNASILLKNASISDENEKMMGRLEKEKEALEKAENERERHSRELDELFRQKIALDDELDELREIVKETNDLTESINTYRDGGYKIPLAKFEWEDRYRPLNVFDKDYRILTEHDVAEKLVEAGHIERFSDEKAGFVKLSVKVRRGEEHKSRKFIVWDKDILTSTSDISAESILRIPKAFRKEYDAEFLRDIDRYTRFKDSEFADDVKDTLEKNEELQDKFEKRLTPKRKQRDDFDR